jgi:curved DNA-binding protein CbpA
MIKKIEDLDFYEILNLRGDASSRDIENAYLLALATYHQEGLASYGVLMDEERTVILDKVEDAFQTLRDPEKRKVYDAHVRDRHLEIPQKASFRRSTARLLIEAAPEQSGLWAKIRSVVAPARRRRERGGQDKNGNGRDWRGLPDDFYYYADFLKKVRERRGLSLEDIAEKCGIDPFELQSLEEELPGYHSNGKKILDLLRCYAKCLGLDADNGHNSPSPPRFR